MSAEYSLLELIAAFCAVYALASIPVAIIVGLCIQWGAKEWNRELSDEQARRAAGIHE